MKALKRRTPLTQNVKEPITCIHCNIICRSQKNIITHLKAVHNDHASGLKRCCGVCGKMFLRNSNLEEHIMRHNATKHFACLNCPKRCATKQDLDRHMKLHTGEEALRVRFVTKLSFIGQHTPPTYRNILVRNHFNVNLVTTICSS
eukprot:GFUD01055559.1.p1 GENE.GFUD01055559.1~~GFUD01055559.1.p1  ORF type:complete len:146 (+),score=5.72 GFUD01055559.1:219-656(+)